MRRKQKWEKEKKEMRRKEEKWEKERKEMRERIEKLEKRMRGKSEGEGEKEVRKLELRGWKREGMVI